MKRAPVHSQALAPNPALRRFLYFTAGVCGAAIMVVEILGAKLLAPYVGTSHFVWTAQIVITLLALACGYYLGGKLADRKPGCAPLYLALVCSALYLGIAATQVQAVALACLRFKLALGSLLASAFLFFVPLALLALAGPLLIRVLTPSFQAIGGSVGRLTALSTLGSVCGAVLVGYVLIPLLPNSTTMVGTGLILLAISIAYFSVWERRRAPLLGAGAALAALLTCALLARGDSWLDTPSYRQIYRANSNFGLLEVFETRHQPYRYFLNDYLTQGAYDTDAKKSIGAWSYLLHDLAVAYTPAIEDVLVIGLGVGLVPRQFLAEGARVDVVEINPAVVSVAQRFFDFDPSQVHLALGDGRQFLARCRQQYDTVVLDAFLGDSAPAHLMTLETFTAIRRLLRPEGVLVINCWADSNSRQDFLLASLQKTLLQVFPAVSIRRSSDPGTVVNHYLLASAAPLTSRRAPNFQAVHPAGRDVAERTFRNLVEVDPQRGIILTDDFNPADYFDAASREASRRSMVAAMQAIRNEAGNRP